MKKNLEQIDALLSRLQVSGDSVMYLAQARTALRELYNTLKEDDNNVQDR